MKRVSDFSVGSAVKISSSDCKEAQVSVLPALGIRSTLAIGFQQLEFVYLQHTHTKDSLTNRPSSQGWAPSVLLPCHVMCICVCVFLMRFVDILVVVVIYYLFLYLSIYTYGWYAMNYNFMNMNITATNNKMQCCH